MDHPIHALDGIDKDAGGGEIIYKVEAQLGGELGPRSREKIRLLFRPNDSSNLEPPPQQGVDHVGSNKPSGSCH